MQKKSFFIIEKIKKYRKCQLWSLVILNIVLFVIVITFLSLHLQCLQNIYSTSSADMTRQPYTTATTQRASGLFFMAAEVHWDNGQVTGPVTHIFLTQAVAAG